MLHSNLIGDAGLSTTFNVLHFNLFIIICFKLVAHAWYLTLSTFFDMWFLSLVVEHFLASTCLLIKGTEAHCTISFLLFTKPLPF